MKRISPMSDLGAKKVLASDENKDVLAGLIEDFYEVEVEELVIEKPYSIAICKELTESGEISKLRETLKDIAATFKIADYVNEIQIQRTSFFDERSLYYPLERFCQNYSKAEAMQRGADGKLIRFSSIRPVYSLNILGYTHFHDDEALRILELCDQKRNKRLEKEFLRIGFFELTKNTFEKPNHKFWRDYFVTGEAHPDAPSYIKKASQIIEHANLSEEERRMISTLERLEAYEQAEREYVYAEGIAQGITQGIAQGKSEGRVEVAKNMLADGLKPDVVAKYTGLPLAQIQSFNCANT